MKDPQEDGHMEWCERNCDTTKNGENGCVAHEKKWDNEIPYRIVVIDDVRIPDFPEGTGLETILYRTPAEGLAALQKMHEDGLHIDELWLDHDMGFDLMDDNFLTIMSVVQWLEEQAVHETPLDVSWIFVHTSNGYAGQQMIAALDPHYPHVLRDRLPVKENRDER